MPKYRRPLNTKQLLIIQTLYKFRFATARQIALSQQAKHNRVILQRLKILEEQQYIGKNYNASYKLKGMPASYYLLPKAIDLLKDQQYTDPKVLKQTASDYKKTQKDIDHYLIIFNVYLEITKQGKGVKFFSASELTHFDYLPPIKPDSYIRYADDKEYLMVCLEDIRPMLIKTLIKRYNLYSEDNIWQDATGRSTPTLLIVCSNENIKQAVSKIITRTLSQKSMDLPYLVLSEQNKMEVS